MICASSVTSSAVVGSSAISRSGPAIERERDADALAHAARELVRVAIDPLLGVRDADAPQHVDRAAALLGAARVGAILDVDRLGRDREHRVERGHRVLKDHRDAIAAQAPQLALAELQDVAAVESDLAAADLGIVREQPHHGGDQRGLAAAALPDQPDDLAARHGEIDMPQRMHPPARREEIDREVAHLEQHVHGSISPAAGEDRRRRAASRPGR